MAVLKDLIVHGPSRFVNGVEANSIKADEGIFKFLKAEDLTANKATVVGLLDVQGELHTNKWTSTNIASIGGTFYISPTYKSSTAKLQFGGTANSRNITISNGSFGSASANGLAMSAWVAQSKVMMTGSITYNGTTYPLGTCDGVLNAPMGSTGFTITGVNSAAVETLYVIIETTQVDATDIEISMRTIAGTKPVGILLTSYGVSQATYIDIHGGVNSNTGTPSVPNANPNVRVGYLNGLPSFTIAGVTTATPSGWGIYTDNGYFKGKIAANGGVIGGFTISELQLYTGSHSSYNASNAGLFLGKESSSSSNYYVAGGSGAQWYLKSDGSAKIGAMTLSAAGVLSVPAANITDLNAAAVNAVTGSFSMLNSGVITTNSARTTYNSTAQGLTLDMNGIGAGNGTTNTFKVVASTGALTAGNATLTGGSIAGWSFNTTSLYKNNATPGAASNAMVISTGTSSSTSIGGSSEAQTWMLSAGTGFGVTTGGILYASGAHIAGTIMVGEGSNVYTTEEINNNVEQLREDVYGTVTFEYASGDTIYTVYSDLQSSDDTTVYYYYGGDGSEIESNRVYVNESDLVHNIDGSLKENTKGLVAEQVSKLSATTEDLNTKYDELSNKEDLSLIAQGYATINNDILTLFKQNSNGEVESALELTSTGIDLKAEGITVATMRNDNGIGIMQATNMEQTFVKMIQSDGTELFQWIAQSNGHLSLKKL